MTTKLRIQQAIIAVGALTVGLITVPPAFSASKNECLGGKPTVVGTKGNDVIDVSADEAGVAAYVNGKRVDFPENAAVVIFGDKGNDRIHYYQDGGGHALGICGGDGKDTITGTDIRRIHGGDGYDTVDVVSQCGAGFEIFASETVRTNTAFDEGPCN